MKKIERITYAAMDGEEFANEEECREYETILTIPTGIILMDEKKRLITNASNLDNCYFAYLPTQDAVDWFLMANEYFAYSCDGRVVAAEHLYYDMSNEEGWFSYEDDIRKIENNIKEFDKLVNF